LLNAVCKRQKYTENDARKLMIQMVSALKYLHDRKVIHRDIKPENLILANHCEDSSCDDYVIKIVDFGFSTIETDEIRKPSKYLCGTPGYMAPEIIRDRSYSTKVDIWALGVVFYILLSGLMPFSIKPEGEQYVVVSNLLL
jgi:serine/threonine protein kinase